MAHLGKIEFPYFSILHMSPKKLKFYWLDVFTDKQFEGNQLAVFPEASGLDTQQMQAIAKEMNLSETTFITGSREDQEGREVFTTRIFTKEEELPFAGHPTLGTTFLLSQSRNENRITLDLKVGNITVEFHGNSGNVYGEMKQMDPEFGLIHDNRKIAEVLNVKPEDLDSTLPIQTVSTGNPFIIVPFRHLSQLQVLAPNFSKMEKYLQNSDAKFFYTISRETVQKDAIAHARMIYYGGEDPATGSAAGPAAAWMLKNGLISPDSRHHIEQGMEMGRPSKIFVSGSMMDRNPVDIRVGGYCKMLMQGELELN